MTGDKREKRVRIEQIDGQWAVHIVEKGQTTEFLFEKEEFAKNFAAGQRIRLFPSCPSEGD